MSTPHPLAASDASSSLNRLMSAPSASYQLPQHEATHSASEPASVPSPLDSTPTSASMPLKRPRKKIVPQYIGPTTAATAEKDQQQQQLNGINIAAGPSTNLLPTSSSSVISFLSSTPLPDVLPPSLICDLQPISAVTHTAATSSLLPAPIDPSRIQRMCTQIEGLIEIFVEVGKRRAMEKERASTVSPSPASATASSTLDTLRSSLQHHLSLPYPLPVQQHMYRLLCGQLERRKKAEVMNGQGEEEKEEAESSSATTSTVATVVIELVRKVLVQIYSLDGNDSMTSFTSSSRSSSLPGMSSSSSFTSSPTFIWFSLFTMTPLSAYGKSSREEAAARMIPIEARTHVLRDLAGLMKLAIRVVDCEGITASDSAASGVESSYPSTLSLTHILTSLITHLFDPVSLGRYLREGAVRVSTDGVSNARNADADVIMIAHSSEPVPVACVACMLTGVYDVLADEFSNQPPSTFLATIASTLSTSLIARRYVHPPPPSSILPCCTGGVEKMQQSQAGDPTSHALTSSTDSPSSASASVTNSLICISLEASSLLRHLHAVSVTRRSRGSKSAGSASCLDPTQLPQSIVLAHPVLTLSLTQLVSHLTQFVHSLQTMNQSLVERKKHEVPSWCTLAAGLLLVRSLKERVKTDAASANGLPSNLSSILLLTLHLLSATSPTLDNNHHVPSDVFSSHCISGTLTKELPEMVLAQAWLHEEQQCEEDEYTQAPPLPSPPSEFNHSPLILHSHALPWIATVRHGRPPALPHSQQVVHTLVNGSPMKKESGSMTARSIPGSGGNIRNRKRAPPPVSTTAAATLPSNLLLTAYKDLDTHMLVFQSKYKIECLELVGEIVKAMRKEKERMVKKERVENEIEMEIEETVVHGLKNQDIERLLDVVYTDSAQEITAATVASPTSPPSSLAAPLLNSYLILLLSYFLWRDFLNNVAVAQEKSAVGGTEKTLRRSSSDANSTGVITIKDTDEGVKGAYLRVFELLTVPFESDATSLSSTAEWMHHSDLTLPEMNHLLATSSFIRLSDLINMQSSRSLLTLMLLRATSLWLIQPVSLCMRIHSFLLSRLPLLIAFRQDYDILDPSALHFAQSMLLRCFMMLHTSCEEYSRENGLCGGEEKRKMKEKLEEEARRMDRRSDSDEEEEYEKRSRQNHVRVKFENMSETESEREEEQADAEDIDTSQTAATSSSGSTSHYNSSTSSYSHLLKRAPYKPNYSDGLGECIDTEDVEFIPTKSEARRNDPRKRFEAAVTTPLSFMKLHISWIVQVMSHRVSSIQKMHRLLNEHSARITSYERRAYHLEKSTRDAEEQSKRRAARQIQQEQRHLEQERLLVLGAPSKSAQHATWQQRLERMERNDSLAAEANGCVEESHVMIVQQQEEEEQKMMMDSSDVDADENSKTAESSIPLSPPDASLLTDITSSAAYQLDDGTVLVFVSNLMHMLIIASTNENEDDAKMNEKDGDGSESHASVEPEENLSWMSFLSLLPRDRSSQNKRARLTAGGLSSYSSAGSVYGHAPSSFPFSSASPPSISSTRDIHSSFTRIVSLSMSYLDRLTQSCLTLMEVRIQRHETTVLQSIQPVLPLLQDHICLSRLLLTLSNIEISLPYLTQLHPKLETQTEDVFAQMIVHVKECVEKMKEVMKKELEVMETMQIQLLQQPLPSASYLDNSSPPSSSMLSITLTSLHDCLSSLTSLLQPWLLPCRAHLKRREREKHEDEQRELKRKNKRKYVIVSEDGEEDVEEDEEDEEEGQGEDVGGDEYLDRDITNEDDATPRVKVEFAVSEEDDANDSITPSHTPPPYAASSSFTITRLRPHGSGRSGRLYGSGTSRPRSSGGKKRRSGGVGPRRLRGLSFTSCALAQMAQEDAEIGDPEKDWDTYSDLDDFIAPEDGVITREMIQEEMRKEIKEIE